MPSIVNSDNGAVSGSAGLKYSSDGSGVLALQTNGTTAVTVDASQNTTLAGTLTTSSRGIAKASMPSGSVLQVVSATYSTQVSSITSTPADTGLTASITPTSATSKILVIVSQAGVGKVNSDTAVVINLLRASSILASFSVFSAQTDSTATNTTGGSSINYLDSPATTSSTTYKTQFYSFSNTNGVFVQKQSAVSSITLMEIAA
jgi:hypothetical protein